MKSKINSFDERTYITNLKGLLICLVVIGHFLQPTVELTSGFIKCIIQGVVIWIYSFHMPLFIFVSGYLSKNYNKRRNKAFEEILLPYLVLQVIFLMKNIINNGVGVLQIFTPCFALWYLLALYIWRIVLPDLIRIKHIIWVALFLNICYFFISDLGQFMALDRCIGFLFYFLMGYFADLDIIKKLKQNKYPSICGS